MDRAQKSQQVVYCLIAEISAREHPMLQLRSQCWGCRIHCVCDLNCVGIVLILLLKD